MSNGSTQDSAVSKLYGPTLDDLPKQGERTTSAAERAAHNERVRKMVELEIAARERFGPNAPSIIQPPPGQFQEKERGRFEWGSGEGLIKLSLIHI